MKWLTASIVAFLVALAPASAASAAGLGFEPGSFTAQAHDAAGDDVTQAAAHPDVTVDFMVRSETDENGSVVPSGSLRDLAVELPPGFVGNPQATPRCRHTDFMSARCERSAMVGIETLKTVAVTGAPVTDTTVPVYNIVPPAGVPARFGFQVASVLVTIDMAVRSDGGYNLVARLSGLSSLLQIHGSVLTLWGVPADVNGEGPLEFTSFQDGTYGGPGEGPRRPFLFNPSVCGAPPRTTIAANSWQRPDAWATDAYTAASGVTGCDRLAFQPAVDLRPEHPRAGAPSAYAVTVSSPQSDDPDGLGTPPVRDVAVTLPEGVAISPSASDGLHGCTDEQAGLGTLDEPACPAASKIGTVEIDTPVLSAPMTGAIFLGTPKSMDAQTGEMVRVLLVASGEGVTVKLPGRITPDPATGRVSAVFAGNPQLPFSQLRLRFQGGAKAPLTNPRTCGTYTTTATITSWAGQSVTSSSSFDVTHDAGGGPCAPLRFTPSFGAGTASAAAGARSAFTLRFGRDDTQADLRDVTVDLPPGLTALIASADLCPDGLAAAGACGAGSRIGSVQVAAGAGEHPFQLPGRVYVTGPYRGAPYGMAIVVPAVAGPFDLGTVVVRAAIRIDPRTAALQVASDPLPTILQGIPLRIRAVDVAIDRAGFMLNGTSCAPRQVTGAVRSTADAVANVAAPYQLRDCAQLPSSPRMLLRVGRRGRTREGITTPFSATLRLGAGQANLREVAVTLPKTINARLDVVNDACTLEAFEAGRCHSRVGTATAVTPLLRDPLRGTAHFVRNPARRLPDLMVALHGQGRSAGVRIDLAGRVTIPRNLSLRTVFDTIPDVPISMFRLDLVAGRRGSLGTTADLCRARTRRAAATIGLRAQNGRLTQVRPRLRIKGCR